MNKIPEKQYAVQLVGPDELKLNKEKDVHIPGEHQLLAKVEAVGLCFSDLKLLKQFTAHARKSDIISGMDTNVLEQIPSYVPNEAPAVPGHEAVVRIVATGPGIDDFKPGQRFLVQTDYRWLRTEKSNAAFGYNFEGALQEYVLMDKRVITSPQGESLLIPVPDDLSASAIALVEPWACVEDAYATKERTRIKTNGQMLIVADEKIKDGVLQNLFDKFGKPSDITWISKHPPISVNIHVKHISDISDIGQAAFDDVLYFGADPDKVEKLFAKVAAQGLINIVQCGNIFERDVTTMVGRVHYGGIRIIGTNGCDPCEAMEHIPQTGQIRAGDRIDVIGAGGPMGMMNVIRNICQGIENITVYAGDLDEDRLNKLSEIAKPLAEKKNLDYRSYNPKTGDTPELCDYIVLMAPIPDLVTFSVNNANRNGIINIFAGIPASVTADINLDRYIKNHLYFIGTSGSVIEDMKAVLKNVTSGSLDTNVSVAAVSGLDEAEQGIRAVENRKMAGKIIVYPQCKGLGLTKLDELKDQYPEVAAKLENGLWTKQAEDALLKVFEKE